MIRIAFARATDRPLLRIGPRLLPNDPAQQTGSARTGERLPLPAHQPIRGHNTPGARERSNGRYGASLLTPSESKRVC